MKRMIFCAAIALSLAACQTTGQGPKLTPLTTPMSAAALPPQFKVGDTLTGKSLSSGRVVTVDVIRAGDDSYTIRTQGGKCEDTYSHSLGFYAPIRGDNCSYGSISRDISGVDGSLWPLQVGNKVTFGVRIDFRGIVALSAACSVVEQGKLTLPYGDDDVFKVVCDDTMHIITSYYSPTKQAIVKYRFERPGTGDVYNDREIVSIDRK